MLSLVGRAVAVNPDSALRAEAKRHGWEIRDFRTGRKAARIGIPAAALRPLGAAAAGGPRGRRPDRPVRRPARRLSRGPGAGQRQVDRRWTSRRYSVDWIVSRTRSVRSKTAAGSSAVARP